MARTGKEGLEVLDKWWGDMMKLIQEKFNFSSTEVAYKIHKKSVDGNSSYLIIVHPRVHKKLRKCYRENLAEIIAKKPSKLKVIFRGTGKITFIGAGHAALMNFLRILMELFRAHVDAVKEKGVLKRKRKLEKIEREARIILEPIFGNSIKSIRVYHAINNPPESRYCIHIKLKRRKARNKKEPTDIKFSQTSPLALKKAIRRAFDLE